MRSACLNPAFFYSHFSLTSIIVISVHLAAFLFLFRFLLDICRFFLPFVARLVFRSVYTLNDTQIYPSAFLVLVCLYIYPPRCVVTHSLI